MGSLTSLQQMEMVIMDAFSDIPCGETVHQETLIHCFLEECEINNNQLKAAFFDLLKKGWIERASINDWRLTREGYKSIHTS